MAATCSLPRHSTLQSWDTGHNRSPARGKSIFSASHSSNNRNGTTNIGSDHLRQGPHHQLPSNGTREMDKVSVSGHGVPDNSRQEKPQADLSRSAPLGMMAKHGEPSPILKRSCSTPAVGSMTQESAASAGEKKRNKLGYHRTSIACSKCFTDSDLQALELVERPCSGFGLLRASPVAWH